MDLLTGYGSSDDDDDDDDSNANGSSLAKQEAVAPPSPVRPKSILRKTTTTPKNPVSSQPTISNPASKKTTKKKLKLVSLHALLPQHILDQLTNGTANLDSDEEEEDEGGKSASHEPPQRAAPAGAGIGKDRQDIMGLLSELSSTKVIGSSSNSNKTSTTTKRQRMGEAFQQTVVVKRHKATTNNDAVIDIHGNDNNSSSSNDPIVETIHNGDDSDSDDTPMASTSVPSGAPAPRPMPAITPRPAIRQQQPQQVSHAAAYPQSLDQPKANAHPASANNLNYPQPSLHHNNNQDDDHDDSVPKLDSRRAKKRSHRQIEKALRAGNLDVLDQYDDTHIQSVHAQNNVYVPEQQQQHHQQTTTGIRVAPVAMYDTKAGTDVVGGGFGTRARGKNQINYLMASAAAYQANQYTQQAKLKTHRADAKRKYGW